MKETFIDGVGQLYYATPQDVEEMPDGVEKAFFSKLFLVADDICESLDISCPDIATTNTLVTAAEDGTLVENTAMLFSNKKHSHLDKPIMLIATARNDKYLMLGSIAHELRHQWQEENRPELSDHYAYGMDTLYDEAEIDADSFAIRYIAINAFNDDYEEAAKHVCPFEKELCEDAYNLRIERAKQLKTKTPLTTRIIRFLKARKNYAQKTT